MTTLRNFTIRTAEQSDLAELELHEPIPGIRTCTHKYLLENPNIATLYVAANEWQGEPVFDEHSAEHPQGLTVMTKTLQR